MPLNSSVFKIDNIDFGSVDDQQKDVSLFFRRDESHVSSTNKDFFVD